LISKFLTQKMLLKVNITKKEPGVFVVPPEGSIDTETSPDLQRAIEPILNDETKVIILNKQGVNFITSMGLSIIFRTKQTLEAKKSILMVTNLQPKVQKVFELVKAIPDYIFATMEEADTHLDAFLAQNE